MKKKIPITKKQFIESIDLIKKQFDVDKKFADTMSQYLDGMFISTMSTNSLLAFEKLFNYMIGDINSPHNESWMSWFIYENDFGARKLEAYINNNKYVIDSPESFYSFIEKYINIPE